MKAQTGGVEIYLHFFFDLGAGWGWVVDTFPPAYWTPEELTGTHCTRGCVGPRAGLDGCGKSCPHRDSIPEPFSPQ
jgi:hypothetical protein